MPKVSCRTLIALTILCCTIAPVHAEETAPVFELDCVSFAGRFLDNAPVKKKAHPGLAVDGTVWAIAPDTKQVSITRIFPGEAAEKAGLEVGDQIISVNGYLTDGVQLRDLFCAYHMYDAKTMTEALTVQKKDGTKKTVKLPLLTLDSCNAEEKRAWLNIYKGLGY